MEDFIDYDAEDNSRRSYALAVREVRLDRIRRGMSHPRPHCPEEMAAWREGVVARACINVALAAVFVVVGVMVAVTGQNPPAGKFEAAAIGAR